MVRILVIVILLVQCMCSNAQSAASINYADTSGIKFDDGSSWQQVLQKARAGNKYIFVDCYTTWCKPCKEMDKFVYPLDTVGDFFNKHFISIKLQMDTSKNDSEQIKGRYSDAHFVKEKYAVTAFPTFLFFTPDGKILRKSIGGKKANEFIALAADIIDPGKQYYKLLEKFEKNPNAELDEMIYLARTALSLGDSTQALKIASRFFGQTKQADWFSKNKIQFVYDFTKRSSDQGFAFFYKYPEKINGIMGDDTYAQQLVQRVITSEIVVPAMDSAKKLKVQPDWNEIGSRVQKKYDKYYAERVIISSRSCWALQQNNNREYTKYLTMYMEMYGSKKNKGDMASLILNNYAWEIFLSSNDKSELEKALGWSARAVMMFPTANWMDTYANILYKLGKKDEAILWEEVAVKLDPKNEEFITNLAKMKKQLPTWTSVEKE
jgi:thioredoxin-related protein